MSCCSKQCVAAARGDTSFFVRSELVPSLSYRLVSMCVCVLFCVFVSEGMSFNFVCMCVCYQKCDCVFAVCSQAATMRFTAFQVAFLVLCKSHYSTFMHACTEYISTK